MKIRLFKKSIIGLILVVVILLLIMSLKMKQNDINVDEYASQVPNLAGVRG